MTQDRLEQIISNPNTGTTRVSSLVGTYALEQDKAKWNKSQQVEYDKLYPAFRVGTEDEYVNAHKDGLSSKVETVNDEVVYYVEIDYSKDETYLSFEKWLAETKIVTPAVEEVKDADGNVTTPAQPAVTEPVRVFVPKADYSADIDTYMAGSSAYKARLKEVKLKELGTLKVEANTVLYDANGKALGNMSSVVAIANWKYNQAIANGATVADAYTAIFKDTIINWRGADNAVHQVQVESICEALEASMHQIAVVIGVE